MDRDDGFESDLDAIRELLQKYGLQQFENMVHIASRSREYSRCGPAWEPAHSF
jgi:hypothetical protein